jgi:iron complex outermembrane recepter protein
MKNFKHVFLITAMLFMTIAATWAQKTITGTVTDAESNEALVGAAVTVKGTSKGAITDVDGKYSIDAPDNATTLVFSFVGYTSKEVAIGISTQINVIMGTGLELNNVVVIGSRNATRTKIETPVAVDVIPLANIVNEVGQVDINQILTYIAPSFQSSRQAISDGTDHVDPAQLRGLGPDQVLILVNGKRRHQSALVSVNGTVNRGTVGTDMNAIPATAVERIEILRDGAAAQYGSDAIAGVINIVLKRASGVSGSVSYGTNTSTYAKNFAAKKLVTGFAGDENVSVTDGGTLQGGLSYGLKIGEKGYFNVSAEYTSRDRSNRTGTYTGQIWPSVGGADKSDSLNTVKGTTRNTFDMIIGNSQVKGGGVMVNLALPLGESGFEFYTFGGFNSKKGNAAGFYRYPNGVWTASSNSSPFWTGAGKGRDKVLALYPNGFLPEINSNVTDISASAGVRGDVKGWSMDLSQTFGQNTFDFSVDKSVNYSQAADTTFTGALQTNFNAGGTEFKQYTTNLDFSKKHEVLEGLNTAFGAEFRIDQFGINAGEESSWKNYNTKALVAAGAQVFSGFLQTNVGSNSRNNFAIYSDNEIDISKQFMIAAAVRFEQYSDFGSTFNYKFASRYKIADGFTVRASTSTGFRAPSQQQKYFAKSGTLFINGPNGLQPTETGTFTNDSKAATLLGIPKLKQETSNSFGVGFTGRLMEGLELTVDAYQIDIKDRIVLTNNFNGGNNPALQTQLNDANANTANFFTNAIDTRSRGIEAVLNYSKKFGTNQEIRIVGAFTSINNEVIKGADGKPAIKASDAVTATGQLANYFNREDQSRIEVANPVGKGSLTVNYKMGAFGAMVRATYFGKVTYLDPINIADTTSWPRSGAYLVAGARTGIGAFRNALTGTNDSYDQVFNEKYIFDVALSYAATKQVSIVLGANNLLDTYQDLHTHSTNVSLGRFNYSRRVQQMGFNGRYVFARLTFKL